MIKKGNITVVCPEEAFARKVAEAIVKKIESYHIPAAVRRKINIHALTEVTEPWLIICCTPEAKIDAEINEETDAFIREGLREHIAPVLVSGSPEESFPESLLHIRQPDGTEVEVEPLAANVTAPSIRESLRKLNTEVLRLFAPMLGVSFDELNRRDWKRKKGIFYAVGATVIFVAMGLLVYSIDKVTAIREQNAQIQALYSEKKQAEEEMQAEMNEAIYQNQLLQSRRARKALEEYDVRTALQYCLEGFADQNPESCIDDLKVTLNDALNMACASGYVPITNKKSKVYVRIEKPTGGYPKTFQEELPEEFRDYLEEKYEADLTGKELLADFTLQTYAADFAIYYGVYKDSSIRGSFYCQKVHFRNHPERDYYFRDQGGHYYLSDVIAFENDTFIGHYDHGKDGDYFCRYDALTGKLIEKLDFGTLFADFHYSEDRSRIIFLDRFNRTMAAFSPQTGEELYRISGPWIHEDLAEYITDDGRGYLVGCYYKAYVYDMASGKLLGIYETEDSNGGSVEVSSEGILMMEGSEKIRLYDLSSGTQIAEIPNRSISILDMAHFIGEPGKYYPTYSAELITNGSIHFQYYRDALPVPETWEEKIKLAEQLERTGRR